MDGWIMRVTGESAPHPSSHTVLTDNSKSKVLIECQYTMTLITIIIPTDTSYHPTSHGNEFREKMSTVHTLMTKHGTRTYALNYR